ncbi:SDH4 [Candida pseudojiufengensis]|uniref:SDH4 n=1 Tax=Candida pseudojiufengensis TaxID=497109 RepID=UPI0022254AA7|nr:SDH4 [Candida pseudojiufengensis]KAI5961198.1 SDH4 [Candida pseudojiufengensis]
MLSRLGLQQTSRLSSKLVRPTLVRGIKTIPQPPGFIVGTVNDAYVPPKPHKLEGSYHWTAERLVSIGLVPLTLLPIFTGASTLVDSTLSALLLYHCYAGFQSCIIDYIPKRVYGDWYNYAMYLLTFGTGVAGYGIYVMEKKDGGIVNIVSKIWKA